MSSTIHHHLRLWLVDHPTISTFEWKENQTLGASLPFVITTILTYLTLTFLLRGRLPSPSPFFTRAASSIHNLVLLTLSLAMALGCSLAALAQSPSPQWLLCFPPNTPPSGPVFFWAHVFYLSKIYELLDTLFILLAGGHRLTFLHVYHHALVIVMCYLWLAARQSLLPVALVTNAGVHVVMYGYYFSSSVGWRWPARWKRRVTELQIWQFGFSFVASLGMLVLHFGGEAGCQGMEAWLFNAVFNVSLLALFLDFHSTAYAGRRKKKDL